MSDEKKVVELVPPGAPLPQPESPDIPSPPPPPPQKEPAIVSGYAVGFKENGELFFQVLGNRPGLVELLGIHKYAEEYIRGIMNGKLETPEATMINKLNSIIMLLTNKPLR